MRISVTLSLDAGSFEDTLLLLEREGVVIEQVLPAAGVVSGSVEEAEVGRIGNLPGVRHCEPSRRLGILDGSSGQST